MENNELLHAGVKGMKWGQRLYQYKDGSLTPLGKARYGNKKNYANAKRKATIAAKKKAQEKEAAKIKKKTGETPEEQKERILKSRSAKELYENAHLFTTQELQSAYNRLQLEKNIKDMAPKEVKKGEEFVNKSINVMDKAAQTIQSGSKLYNGVARVLNAFGGKDLPIIDFGKSDNKKKKSNDSDDSNKKEEKKSKKEEKKESKEDSDASETYTKQTFRRKKKEEKESVTGEVFGEGTSKGSQSRKEAKSTVDDIIYDAEWRDVTPSNLPSTYVSRGESFVTALLEEPKR